MAIVTDGGGDSREVRICCVTKLKWVISGEPLDRELEMPKVLGTETLI